MIRPVVAYVLASIILLSQIGLPLHMHYCKGALESISVLFAARCNEHEIPAGLLSCCDKPGSSHCSKSEDKKCCNDEVKVLKQDFTSLSPSFSKWIDAGTEIELLTIRELNPVCSSLPIVIEGHSTDTGPPFYILHQALIFYA